MPGSTDDRQLLAGYDRRLAAEQAGLVEALVGRRRTLDQLDGPA